jgi:hypothetical protein
VLKITVRIDLTATIPHMSFDEGELHVNGLTRSTPVLALAVLSAMPVVAPAADPDPTTQPTVAQLQEQIRQLQAQVQKLESGQSTLNSRVVDETVERVLRDADRRSKLLQNDASMTAGFANDKFFIASADGNWSLKPGVLWQFRNVTNWTSDAADDGDDEIENGFENRRTKFNIEGTAVTKNLYYKFQWESNRSSDGFFLDDALLRYKHEDGFSIQAGQYKDPWYKEETMSDARQLAAERSLLNALIAGGVTGRVQGVSVIHEGDNHRGEVMFHDGADSQNTAFFDGVGAGDFLGGGTNYGASARFDWYFAGKTTRQVDDFSAMNNKEDLFVVGGGVEFTEGGDNTALFHTIDAQWENTGGLGMYGALVGVYRDLGTGAAGGTPPAGDFYDWGGLIQGGYLLNDKWEVFARYDITLLDDAALPAGSEDVVHEITVGSTYFFYKHNVKFVLDGSYLPNGSPFSQTGLGVSAGDEDQFILRGQLQLYL